MWLLVFDDVKIGELFMRLIRDEEGSGAMLDDDRFEDLYSLLVLLLMLFET